MKVGTRRNPRAAAGAFGLEEFYPRAMVEPDGALALTQEVSLALPPYGFDGAIRTPVSGAVVGQFSGFSIFSTRSDGFWLQEGFLFTSAYWSMYPEDWTHGASADVPFWACSMDEGWVILAAELGITFQYHAFIGTVGLAPGGIAYTSGSSSLSSRIGGPIWVPPRSFIHVANETANTACQGMIRLRMGGKTP